MGLPSMFNLEKQFIFYASYHNHPVNIAIHLMCIWPLLITMLILLHYTPVLAATPAFLTDLPYGELININAGFFFTLMYMVCYVVMDPIAGGLGACLVSMVFLMSSKLVAASTVIYGYPLLHVAGAVHVVAWIIQFIGHGCFEGRAPALLEHPDQAFLTAPLFVLLEVIFFFGYRKEFHTRMMKQVEINVRAFHGAEGKPVKSTKGGKKPKKA